MAAFKALGKKAETLAVMPNAFDQPTTLAAKQINRTTKRILTKRLLHQRRQAIHAAAPITAPRRNPPWPMLAGHRMPQTAAASLCATYKIAPC